MKHRPICDELANVVGRVVAASEKHVSELRQVFKKCRDDPMYLVSQLTIWWYNESTNLCSLSICNVIYHKNFD